jgi:GNAT superfamily N-acetyltransferase
MGPAEVIEVELRDGAILTVRPVRPDDKRAIADGFRRMSERSRYQRFLTVRDALSTKELRYLTEIDHHDHEALIAHDAESGQGAGIGRFVRDPTAPKSAEAAVAVVDEWQHRGLGTALTGLLADRARAEGIERLTALLLAENMAMLSVLEGLGPARTVSREGPLLQVEIDLPEEGIGEHMAGVLRVAATGGAEAALPTDELRIPD